MRLELFGHPFSSYTWKALIAFYETDTPFNFRILGPDEADNGAAFSSAWPLGKFPLLMDDGEAIMESSIIVEHVAPQLIPPGHDARREARMLDRIFDNHVMTPVQAIVAEHIPFLTPKADADRIARSCEVLDKIYPWLDARLAERLWAAGEDFTLADCAGAPALFYADWVHEIPAVLQNLRAYRAKLLARMSVARCIEEARPYRHLFPLGAPDRD